MREKITSWNSETVGSGSVVNEVQFSYNDFGQMTHDYQAHGGAVNTSTSPKVQYGYANGSANTVRPSTLTYPNGRVLTYSYGSVDSTADVLSRVAGIVDDDVDSTHLADYSYLGLGTFVEVDYAEPEIRYTLVGTAGGDDPNTGDIYRGFDRFGRIKDSYWRDYGNSTDVDRIKHGYDRNGNRTYRENTLATANNAYFDEVYQYDAIHGAREAECPEGWSYQQHFRAVLDARHNWQLAEVHGRLGWRRHVESGPKQSLKPSQRNLKYYRIDRAIVDYSGLQSSWQHDSHTQAWHPDVVLYRSVRCLESTHQFGRRFWNSCSI
jgi:hypothetical protein